MVTGPDSGWRAASTDCGNAGALGTGAGSGRASRDGGGGGAENEVTGRIDSRGGAGARNAPAANGGASGSAFGRDESVVCSLLGGSSRSGGGA